jgi:TolB protein
VIVVERVGAWERGSVAGQQVRQSRHTDLVALSRSHTRARRSRSGGRRGIGWILVAVLLLAALPALAACGRPEPTPGSAASGAGAEAKRLPGRLLFVRGGNVWSWSGGQEAQLTDGGADSQPRWSPDGSAFLFVRGGDSFADLWLATDGGQTLRQLTSNQAKRYQPDTKQYVDNSFMLTGPSWVRLASGEDRIVYSTDAGGDTMALWILGGLGGKPAPVYGTKGLTGHVEGAALSPDGRSVAFTLDTTDPQTYQRTTQLYLVDLESGAYRPLTTDPAGSYDAAWSPDGQWLAYASRQDGGTNLWAVRAGGSDRHRLTDGGNDRAPVWSPDGDQLAFVRLQGNGYSLFSVDLTAPNGDLAADSAQQVAGYTDVDPASGISWVR